MSTSHVPNVERVIPSHIYDSAEVTASTSSRALVYHMRSVIEILRRIGTRPARELSSELLPYLQAVGEIKFERLHHGVNDGNQ